MFSVYFGGTRWRAGVPFLALLALLLTVDRSGAAVMCLLASFLHECGHIAVLCLLGHHPREVTVGVCGIRLVPDSRPLGYVAGVCMLAAGPVLNLMVAAGLWVSGARGVAVASHLVLGAFNLLPVEALDGGQILRCLLLRLVVDDVAERVVRIVSVVVLLPLSTLGFLLLLYSHNPTLLLVCGYLIARLFSHERI